ncbi:uncharacterized protein LOC111876912 [Lactuca sativa]|uniref:uncharacterized protein LOC111876912 n=1 Tax=Lactuca sativa TaxID=4236 RepID=UPI000CD93F0F|nr:uncharacterized protein LOC111876912 [Lactuca sativa]
MWACGGDKAPGPNGLTFKFIKRYWDIISDDLMRTVRKFEDYGTLSKGCNSSFITLAPKSKDPTFLVDFRSISLIGCIYKIISKVLATILKTIIGSVIDEVQSTYVEGRSILEGPLIVNEICSWVKKTKKKVLLFKLDFDKAFDSVNWEYFDSILNQMRFGNKWRKQFRGCLSSVHASVIINCSPTKEFNILKG